MKVHVLRRQQVVAQPLERVFQFFSRPENLARLTPDALRFRTLTPSPIVMKPGTMIDYTIRVLGIPVRWKTLITSYDPPRGFVDEQVRGPYAFWFHRHTFFAVDGGTEIIDEVHYALPGGVLAPVAHTVFVRRQIGKIFDYRAKAITRFFENGTERAAG